MDREKQERYLRIALKVFGLTFILGLPLMAMVVWPAAWTWEPRQPEYEQMMMGIYATLGVFLIWASRDPMSHKSLIWFTVWSSAVHGGIMAAQALMDPADRINLLGDVAGLFLVAVVLGLLMPRRTAGLAYPLSRSNA
ncbi:MAG: hypothetical protein PVH21_08455 [Myxococcales bacterium]|jgi:lipid-A-disaccharide synthase-like uncharacterized protein